MQTASGMAHTRERMMHTEVAAVPRQVAQGALHEPTIAISWREDEQI